MASRTTTDPIEILLEMGVDLDNLSSEEDYLSALMEAAATIEFQTKGSGDKRSVILRKEIIAVRKKRKAADKNFKARKTTVSASSFKKGTAAAGRQKALPSAIKPKTSIIPYKKFNEVDEEEGGKKARTRKKTDKDQNLLQGIAKSVSNIADIMKKQYALKKKKGAYDRKRAEAEKRKLKESNLEKRYKGLASAAEKVIAPVKNALKSILDFFLNIIIGRFLVKFIRWFGDPKNKKKVDSVVRFLVDHGPKLLAAFLLFGTSIGRFAVRLSTVLLKGALRLGAAAAKFAFRFAMANPAAAAITAIVGGTAIGAIMQANTQSNDPDAPEGRTQLEDTMDYGGVTGDPVAGAFQYGGTIPYYNDGGGVESGKITTNSGSDITGAGPDTQLIAAQPGEIVINKRTVDAVGADHFLGLNRQYGGAGANKPKTATVQTASGGGVVLPAFSNGGQVGSYNNRSGVGAGSPMKGYEGQREEASAFKGLKDFKERYIEGDNSFLNRLAHGDTEGALKTLGIKIDNNTEAVNKNTDQRRKDSKDSKNNQQRIKQFIDNRKKELEAAGPGIAGFLSDRQKDLERGISGATEFAQRMNPLPALGRDIERRGSQPSAEETAIAKLTAERIASGQLTPEGRGLTKDTQEALKKHDNYIRSLYAAGHRSNDPSIERNAVQKFLDQSAFGRRLQNINADIQNRGLIMDPLMMLKTEQSDKMFEFLTGGRLKNAGASIQGMQMSVKGLMGPLGRMFRLDDMGSIGRYARPAMEHAQSLGVSAVNNTKFFNRKSLDDAPGSANMYDKLLPNKFANLALGQFHFDVDESGRAIVTDDYDASQLTPEQYHQKSRAELVKIGKVLQGKGDPDKNPIAQILGGLMEAYKMHGSAQLATKQNLGQSNIRPIGLDVDMGGGFLQTTKKGKVIPKMTDTQRRLFIAGGGGAQMDENTSFEEVLARGERALKPQLEKERASSMAMIMGGKDAYYSSTTGRYYKNYAEALKDPKVAAAAKVEKTKASLSFPTPSMTMPGPPPGGGNNVKVIRIPSSATSDNPNDRNTGGSDVDASPTGNGNQAKWNIFGIPMPF